MKVDIRKVNPAFQSIMRASDQPIFLDANFFIPPDRSSYKGVKAYSFEQFKESWIEPLLSEFPGLAVHESVYDELVAGKVRAYVNAQCISDPERLKIHYDAELNETETALMNYYINKIAVHSLYDPYIDNAKDRGEVRSLSFMAVKQYLYFAANDALAVRLIKDADKLKTGLDDMGILQMYELIYYLYMMGKYSSKELRTLYKYQYYLTTGDKRINPEWGTFVKQMDIIYRTDNQNTFQTQSA